MSYDFLEDADDALDKCNFPYAVVLVNGQGTMSLSNLADTTKEKQLLILGLEKLARELKSEIFR